MKQNFLSGRKKHIKVKTAKGRKISSTRWLNRQLNDPYVIQARKDKYRSRAAYKILELDEKFHFIDKASYIIDLGAAPGSWSQAILRHKPKAKIIAVDLQDINYLHNVEFVKGDIFEPTTLDAIMQLTNTKLVDLVISDMAPPATGHQDTDHLRNIKLCERVLDLCPKLLKPGGNLVLKTFNGTEIHSFSAQVKAKFKQFNMIKPQATRSDSNELYIVAQNYLGD